MMPNWIDCYAARMLVRFARPLVGALSILGIAILVAGCPTREDSAQRAGREAAAAVSRGCEANADRDACRSTACRERCATFADSDRLFEVCASRCLGEGICSADSDCADGLVCVMFAPRVRRCGRRPAPEP